MDKTQFKQKDLPFGIELTQFMYLIFSLLGTASMILKLIFLESIEFEFFWGVISVGTFWILFYGTFKIKSWVVTPVLVVSVFASFNLFFDVMLYHPTTSVEIAKKIFKILLCSFFLFQLAIFSRQKTRSFFNEKGTTFIS